jgi:hypothetical protein
VPPVTLAAVALALAAAGCADGDGKDFARLNQTEACKAVREKLTLPKLQERFGKPDGTQDFFGDTIVSYEGAEEVRWQFQISAQAGTFRALTVEGKREEIVECPPPRGP